MARMTDGVFRPDEPGPHPREWSLEPMEALPPRNTGRDAAGVDPHVPAWAPMGPGWHDSSWLLRRGLVVTELRYGSQLEAMLKALQTQSRPDESALHAPA